MKAITQVSIAVALALGAATGAYAQASGAMSNDAMSHNSMSKDSMSHDKMGKGAMSHDAMSKNDKMKKHDAMGMDKPASGAMAQ
jgi:pentapeptide MXKDX repeat protein